MIVGCLPSRRLSLALAFVLASAVVGARSEDAAQPPSAAAASQKAPAGGNRGDGNRAASPPATPEAHRLPPDSTTKQTLDLGGRSLAFTATAGSTRLFNDKGEPQADVAYTSYQLDGTERTSRPVTFLFNGGPGAASAYLQLGNNGPWRLPIDANVVTPSSPPELKPNAETWLDFTDLVYIDPVGTGYSRFVATGENVRRKFFSIDGDVAALALVIRRWL
jgi:carboxypeptidase C (cathepsin A)